MLSPGDGCSILADDIVSEVRFEIPRSLPTSFDTRLGQPADDTSDQMAHHVLPFHGRPTPRVAAAQVLVPIAINTK